MLNEKVNITKLSKIRLGKDRKYPALVKSFSDESGIPLTKVKKMWIKAEEIVKKQYKLSPSDEGKFYSLVVGILKGMTKLKNNYEGLVESILTPSVRLLILTGTPLNETLMGRVVLVIDDYFYDHPSDMEMVKERIQASNGKLDEIIKDEGIIRIAKTITRDTRHPVSPEVLVKHISYWKSKSSEVNV